MKKSKFWYTFIQVCALVIIFVGSAFGFANTMQGRSLSQGLDYGDAGDFSASNISVNAPLQSVPGFIKPTGVLGHWGVGNGGDWLRIGFSRAKEHAAQIVTRLKPQSLGHLKDENIRNWILANRESLAADILASEHLWELERRPTCAWTLRPQNEEKLPVHYPIQLSYPACRDFIKSFYEATQLLIHESVHHFDQGETFADQVAIAIVDAWRSGSIDWLAISKENSPKAREKHSAVWTGEEMIIFGGEDRTQNEVFNSAAAYDPLKLSWRDLPEFSNQTARYFHQSHWAEDQMISWGGYQKIDDQTSVWLYEGLIWRQDGQIRKVSPPPSWKPVDHIYQNDPRQQSAWTGKNLMIWGGLDENKRPIGGSYDPNRNLWVDDLGRDEPLAPARVGGHSVTWTGSKLLVWGGYEAAGRYSGRLTNAGAVYDPSQVPGQRWRSISQQNAPDPRAGHTAIWIGKELIVFSGGGIQSSPEITGTGGIYNPETDQWSPLASEMVLERIGHTGIWNGHEMLIYGGRSKRLSSFLGQVFSFNPEGQRWSGVNSQFDPRDRAFHSAVWTGSSLMIWGGYRQSREGRNRVEETLNDGGVFYP